MVHVCNNEDLWLVVRSDEYGVTSVPSPNPTCARGGKCVTQWICVVLYPKKSESSRHFATSTRLPPPPLPPPPRNNVWEAKFHRNSILITGYYQALGGASERLKHIVARPIRSTTQIWVVTHHQRGIFQVVPRGSQCWRREMSAVFSG